MSIIGVYEGGIGVALVTYSTAVKLETTSATAVTKNE